MSLSTSQTRTKQHVYRNFDGLDTSRSEVAMEAPEAQPFSELVNGYCDFRGFLSNDRPLAQLAGERQRISHMRFFSARGGDVVYAARTGRGLSLRARTRPGAEEDAFPLSAVPTSCIFNRKAIFCGGPGEVPRAFGGASWSPLSSGYAVGARYCASVQNRLVLAGFDDNPTVIKLSRVNDESVMPEDEDPNDGSVTRAGFIQTANLLGTSEEIRGVAGFEVKRLAIFTSERVLVYVLDPDLTKWNIDDKVTINVGTISHNTIAGAADELFYCSRSGVNSLRRSALNGVSVYTLPLSYRVREIYASLLASVRDKEEISACFDRDEGRYHIMFPVSENTTYRLTLHINPATQEGGATVGKWSLSTFAGLTCGDFIAGSLVFGSTSGFQEMGGEGSASGERPETRARLPLLWHGDLTQPKQSHSMILIASGAGVVTIEAEDEAGRSLGSVVYELPKADRLDYSGVPLPQQFERQFQHRYVGVRLTVHIKADSQVRVFGIGIKVREI